MISSKKITLIGILLMMLVFILTVFTILLPKNILSDNFTGTYSYSDIHSVTFSDDDYYSSYSKNGVTKINLLGTTASSSSKNVLIEGSTVTILGSGTYVISGELLDGNLIVDSKSGGEIRLILNGASVTSSDFSALFIKQADKVVISSVKNTENYFTDGTSYSSEKLEDGKPTATIYSRDDLTINGEGIITVIGNYNDGITANDTLKITEGTLNVTASDDGINANDYIAFYKANVNIEASGDAIKCEHESADKGFIAFEGTTLSLNAKTDAIDASSSIYINDAIFSILAGDDAIHAEKDVRVNAKSIDITECNEGIEGAYIEILGGDIKIISNDDSINAVGENSDSGFMRPLGMHKENITNEDIYLKISGGNVYISTRGDGIDSNGAALISGGLVEVYGPENSGNSSLDFEYGFLINGGTVLAAGSSGMAELPSESSKQQSLVFYLDDSYESGSTISISDSNGTEMILGISDKKFSWIAFSSESLKTSESYTLSINGSEVSTIIASEIVTSSGSNGRRF